MKSVVAKYRHEGLGIFIARLTVLVVALSTTVQGGQEKPEASFARGQIIPLTAEILGTPLAPAAVRLSSLDHEDDWTSLSAGPEGRVSVAWIAFDGRADRVLVREARRTLEVSSWGEAEEVAGPGDFFSPSVAYGSGGTLWVVWSANVGENFELFARRRTAMGWQPPLRLTHASGSDIVPRLATDRQGRVWLAWQGFRDGSFDILLARITENGLADERAVTADQANDWAPSLAVGSSDSIFVAWDTYRNGSYDIYLRRFSSSGEALDEVPIAATTAREANASVAVDAFDRAWVAYDIGEVNWGRHVGLHGQRTIGLRCWDGTELSALQTDIMPSLPQDLQTRSESPQITFDGKGGLHLAFQHFVPQKDAGKSWGDANGIFFWYVAATGGKGWTPPVALRESGGRGDNRLRLVQAGDGRIITAWAADGRSFPYYEVPMNGEVYVCDFDPLVKAEKLQTVAVENPNVEPLPPDQNAQRLRLGGKRLGKENYLLAYGDLHRHTDISRCGFGLDGTLTDAYRYGIDVGGLDFLCISDHDQDLGGWRFEQPAPKMQGYAWWRSQKFADVYSLPGRFLAMYGYERGRSFLDGGGHKNVVYARRGYSISSQADPSALFRDLADREVIVIPHQLANREAATDWAKWSESFERVAEIYQARGSFEYPGAPLARARQFREGNSLWDAYRQGVRIGIIASSDHGSTHNAYAGVLVKQFSREGIMEALRQRRTFGATEVVELIVTLDGRPMGQELTLDSPPCLEIAVRCAEPLAKIEIVKDNHFIFTRDLYEKEIRISFQDNDAQRGGASYYYVRVTTTSGALAWSSPFWVTRK